MENKKILCQKVLPDRTTITQIVEQFLGQIVKGRPIMYFFSPKVNTLRMRVNEEERINLMWFLLKYLGDSPMAYHLSINSWVNQIYKLSENIVNVTPFNAHSQSSTNIFLNLDIKLE